MARKWLVRLAFVLVSLGALFFISLFLVGRLADERLEEELAAIREKREPLLLSELAPPPVPDDRNAAIPFDRAVEYLVDAEGDELEAVTGILEDALGFPPEAVEPARSWLEQNRETLDHIEEALSRPGCRFDYDYSSAEGFLDPTGPGIIDLYQLSELLVVRGILRARGGNQAGALGDAIRAFKLARLMGDAPLLIHAMVRTSSEARALTVLEVALRSGAPDEATRKILLATLDRIDVRGELHTALLGERCFGRSLFALLPDDGDSDAWGRMGIEGLPLDLIPSAVLRLDQANYLNLMGRMIGLSTKPAFETRRDWEAIEDELQDQPWYAIVSRLAMVPMGMIYVQTEKHRAHLDLARIALDLEHAREVTGVLPDNILIPATGGLRGTIDPFSGRDYCFRKTDDGGYLIWSVGPDRKNNHGQDGSEDNHKSGDVVWTR